MPNPFVHVELYSNDLDASKKFYSALLGWKLNEVEVASVPGGKYTMIDVGEGTGGGMLKNPVPGSEGRWVPYVEAADMDAMLAKAQSLGANTMVGKTEIMGVCFIGIAPDPTGVMFGFWQPKK